MDEPISRAEHEEFSRRMEDWNRRQDKRLELLEENVREIGTLAASIERLTISVQSMVKEQERQGQRLETLEGRDGAKWRKLMGYIVSALAAGVVGFLLGQVGLS